MEPGEPNPPDEGQHSNENDSPTEKIKSKLGISIFNLQNQTMLTPIWGISGTSGSVISGQKIQSHFFGFDDVIPDWYFLVS